MSDIVLNNGMNSNTNVESEHVDAAASASSGGALHVDDGGATYDTALDMGLSGSATPPPPPEVAAEATGKAQATVGEASAKVEGTIEGSTGADVPDVDGSLEGGLDAGAGASASDGGASFEGAIEGMLDVLGDLVVQFSGSVTALLGL